MQISCAVNIAIPRDVCEKGFAFPLMHGHNSNIQPLRHDENAQDDAISARTQSEQFKSNFEFKYQMFQTLTHGTHDELRLSE